MILQNKILQIPALLLLIFLQVAIFNNINFLGVVNPYFYIIFVLLFPIKGNKYILLLFAFLLGLGIDFFEHTGGINAAATVFIAYIRVFLIKILTAGSVLENDEIRLHNFNFMQWFLYLGILIFLHAFLINFLESFTVHLIGNVAINSLIGGVLTLILITFYLLIFPPRGSRNEF